jgi:hypothetical protein
MGVGVQTRTFRNNVLQFPPATVDDNNILAQEKLGALSSGMREQKMHVLLRGDFSCPFQLRRPTGPL